MTPHELATILNGRAYGDETRAEEERVARTAHATPARCSTAQRGAQLGRWVG